MESELIPTKVQDFLDEDPPLRGQNYVCLSFLSPEDLLKQKEVYLFEEFTKKFAGELDTTFSELAQRFPDVAFALNNIRDTYSHFFKPADMHDAFKAFCSLESERLEKEFHQRNEFRTTVRGIKVRGVFDTPAEARNRAEFLKRTGDKFDIFIGQVGCWCPWSPDPNAIADQEYAETQLNTFMKKYKENNAQKDVVYEDRKQTAIKNSAAPTVSEITEKLTEIDPWTAGKSE